MGASAAEAAEVASVASVSKEAMPRSERYYDDSDEVRARLYLCARVCVRGAGGARTGVRHAC